MENPIKMDDLGGPPLFFETSRSSAFLRNPQMWGWKNHDQARHKAKDAHQPHSLHDASQANDTEGLVL